MPPDSSSGFRHCGLHRTEPTRDAFEDDVQTVTVGQHRIDKGLGQVDPASTGLQHPLDELLHLRSTQNRGGELVLSRPRHEDPARVVDPDLLDRGVVEVTLQRAEARHPRHQFLDDRLMVDDRGHRTGKAALVVLLDKPFRDPTYHAGISLRVDAVAAYDVAYPRVEVVDQLVM